MGVFTWERQTQQQTQLWQEFGRKNGQRAVILPKNLLRYHSHAAQLFFDWERWAHDIVMGHLLKYPHHSIFCLQYHTPIFFLLESIFM